MPPPKVSFAVGAAGLLLAAAGTLAFLNPDVPIVVSMGYIAVGWAIAIAGVALGVSRLLRTESHAPSTAPAGWYPDPELTSGQRYWDGTRWTDHTA